jgi:hypothetical protein
MFVTGKHSSIVDMSLSTVLKIQHLDHRNERNNQMQADNNNI